MALETGSFRDNESELAVILAAMDANVDDEHMVRLYELRKAIINGQDIKSWRWLLPDVDRAIVRAERQRDGSYGGSGTKARGGARGIRCWWAALDRWERMLIRIAAFVSLAMTLLRIVLGDIVSHW